MEQTQSENFIASKNRGRGRSSRPNQSEISQVNIDPFMHGPPPLGALSGGGKAGPPQPGQFNPEFTPGKIFTVIERDEQSNGDPQPSF